MYAFLRNPEAEASDVVIIGTISISHHPAYFFVLFEVYLLNVSICYNTYFDLFCEPFPMIMHVVTLVGDSLVVD